MKLKCKAAAIAAVFLLLMYPFLSVKGASEKRDMEVYEIDYRGPETHNSRPPPKNMNGKPPFIHHKTSAEDPSAGARLGGKN